MTINIFLLVLAFAINYARLYGFLKIDNLFSKEKTYKTVYVAELNGTTVPWHSNILALA